MAIRKAMRNTSPQVERQVEIRCKQLSGRAVEFLAKVVEDGFTGLVEAKTAIVAAKEILDRGFGRAKQHVDQNVNIQGSDALIDAINQSKARVLEKVSEALTEVSVQTH